MPAVTRNVAVPRDVAEGVRVQVVEADVDPPHARSDHSGTMLDERIAVGRHRQFVETMADMPTEPPDKLAHVAPHERLAATETDLVDPPLDEALGDDRNLFEAQQSTARQERHFLGHAIAASQVAPVGDGNPQIAYRPSVAILQRTVGGRVIDLHCP